MTIALLTPSEQRQQAAVDKAVRNLHRSDAEIAMRDVLELWCRERWPDARLFHELVMGRGTVRADMAAIGVDHLAAFEIKGPFDQIDRLVHQVALFRLAVPELWMVLTDRVAKSADAIRYLLPSVGLIVVNGVDRYRPGCPVDRDGLNIEIKAEAQPYAPMPEALLDLCWVAELQDEAIAHRLVTPSKRPHRHHDLRIAMERLTPSEQLAAVCRQLRGRETLFRADPPIVPTRGEPRDVTSKERLL